MWSLITFSTVLLVRPYVFVGPIGQCSGIGIMLGKRVASPYTVAEDEKTMFVTLCLVMARRREILPPTFTR